MRLIDADALLEKLIKTPRYFDLKFDIDNAPTIEAAPEAEWIPCSERLPKDDEYGWYLVTIKGHVLFVDVTLFNNELWKGLSSSQKVIAWMPFPNPYREESEVKK